MKVFLAVVDEGGFTAAARHLSMTVPHVTRHIAALETQLGTRLLQRTTRSVSLTDSGERYAARVREILESVEAAVAEAQSTTSALQGVLRIVAAPRADRCADCPPGCSVQSAVPRHCAGCVR